MRGDEIAKISVDNVKEHDRLWLVETNVTKTKVKRSFTITGQFFDIVKKYVGYRPPQIESNRFFVNYNRGRCTKQPIGKNKIGKMPRRVAAFLHLPDADKYTGILTEFNVIFIILIKMKYDFLLTLLLSNFRFRSFVPKNVGNNIGEHRSNHGDNTETWWLEVGKGSSRLYRRLSQL